MKFSRFCFAAILAAIVFVYPALADTVGGVYFVAQQTDAGTMVTIGNIDMDNQGNWRITVTGENAAHFRINGLQADHARDNYAQLPYSLDAGEQWSFLITAHDLPSGQHTAELVLWTTQGPWQQTFNGTILGMTAVSVMAENAPAPTSLPEVSETPEPSPEPSPPPIPPPPPPPTTPPTTPPLPPPQPPPIHPPPPPPPPPLDNNTGQNYTPPPPQQAIAAPEPAVTSQYPDPDTAYQYIPSPLPAAPAPEPASNVTEATTPNEAEEEPEPQEPQAAPETPPAPIPAATNPVTSGVRGFVPLVMSLIGAIIAASLTIYIKHIRRES